MLDISLLDKVTLQTLELNGWSPGRRIDVSDWIKELVNEGFLYNKYAEEILEELGGLEVVPKRVKAYKVYPGEFDFCAFDSGSGEYDRMEIFEPLAGENLFPLGMAYGQWFLYVGVSKKIYMGSITELYLLGKNIEEFLNNLILGLDEHKEL